MLFNSLLYFIFFISVFFIYWALSGRARKLFLITASLLFYAVWGIKSEGLLGLRWTLHFIFMNAVNYLLITQMIVRPNRKKFFLILLIGVDLANLAFFKYFYFFLDMANIAGLSLPEALRSMNVFLPLAVSFYTFILVAYAVDVYRGVITERVGIVKFSVFVLFFPHLIAGPIMRHSDFMHQIESPHLSKEGMYRGCWLLLSGLLKKAVLADPMGIIIAPVFREPGIYDGWSILLAGMGFSLQVYADFSGYTDMARGSALLLGYDIPENFLAPFFSKSAKELWQRWHITLATWLRDYIYIPLGGSRTSQWRNYFNLIVTFTLGGLWHGADYTYIAWGGMWGVLLAAERAWEKYIHIKILPSNNPGNLVRIAVMFFLFSLGAIMFRSQKVLHGDHIYSSGKIMTQMIGGIFTNHGDRLFDNYIQSGGSADLTLAAFGKDIFAFEQIGRYDTLFFLFLGLFFFHMIQYRPQYFQRFRKYDPYLLTACATVTGGYILPLIATGSHQFIYFVF